MLFGRVRARGSVPSNIRHRGLKLLVVQPLNKALEAGRRLTGASRCRAGRCGRTCA